MITYSVETNLFINRLKEFAYEWGLKNNYNLGFKTKATKREPARIYLNFGLVVFENDKLHGYFDDSIDPLIGINKVFVNMDITLAQDVLKHEIAHYLCHRRHGDAHQAHGPKFHAMCKEIGANPIAKESMADLKARIGGGDHDKLVEKVKKLLALGSSSNEHEAELATLKANELLMKYNLSTTGENFDVIYQKKLFKVGQKNAKNRTIMGILKTFGVFPVYNRSSGRNYVLEVCGAKANVEIAEYVANFLNTELERLYEKARKEHDLNGLTAKNAFFNGIRIGYTDKYKAQKSELTKKYEGSENQLVIHDDLLAVKAGQLIYENLTNGRGSSERGNFRAKSLGAEAGKNLSINKAVNNKSEILKIGN